MKRTLIIILILVVAVSTFAVAYGLPLLSSQYNLNSLQILFILLVIISCAGIVTAGAFEYVFSIALDDFIKKINQTWSKNNSLQPLEKEKLPYEFKEILQTIRKINAASVNRAKELEEKGGYGDVYYRLVTTISHQLRTPITGINWALGILQDEAKKGKPADIDIVKDTMEATNRVGDIIEELLVGVNEGRSKASNIEAIDIEKLVKNIITESSLLAMQHDVKFETVKDVKLVPLIRGVQYEIRFVLHSLITNAVTYAEKSSKITVTLGQEGSYARVVVHNFGIGIPEKERVMLFSQFGRGSEAIRVNPNGSGLGLYLTKEILANHGGKISFESDEKAGTTFTILLPVSEKGQLENSVHF